MRRASCLKSGGRAGSFSVVMVSLRVVHAFSMSSMAALISLESIVMLLLKMEGCHKMLPERRQGNETLRATTKRS